MKKIILLFMSLLLIGCTNKMSAKDTVSEFFENYRTQDQSVINSLNDYIKEMDDLNDHQKEEYKNALLKQYKNIKYDIVNETYDGDKANILVKVTVFNLYKAQEDAQDYLDNNNDVFLNDNGVYDSDKFMDYKLSLMNNTIEEIEYNIDFNLKKENNKWIIEDLSTSDLEKIHGIYHE